MLENSQLELYILSKKATFYNPLPKEKTTQSPKQKGDLEDLTPERKDG